MDDFENNLPAPPKPEVSIPFGLDQIHGNGYYIQVSKATTFIVPNIPSFQISKFIVRQNYGVIDNFGQLVVFKEDHIPLFYHLDQKEKAKVVCLDIQTMLDELRRWKFSLTDRNIEYFVKVVKC